MGHRVRCRVCCCDSRGCHQFSILLTPPCSQRSNHRPQTPQLTQSLTTATWRPTRLPWGCRPIGGLGWEGAPPRHHPAQCNMDHTPAMRVAATSYIPRLEVVLPSLQFFFFRLTVACCWLLVAGCLLLCCLLLVACCLLVACGLLTLLGTDFRCLKRSSM